MSVAIKRLLRIAIFLPPDPGRRGAPPRTPQPGPDKAQNVESFDAPEPGLHVGVNHVEFGASLSHGHTLICQKLENRKRETAGRTGVQGGVLEFGRAYWSSPRRTGVYVGVLGFSEGVLGFSEGVLEFSEGVLGLAEGRTGVFEGVLEFSEGVLQFSGGAKGVLGSQRAYWSFRERTGVF